ncbi:uncharacterized protein RCO7_07034 [Rhynchosporium graminicola]|uniref:Aminoglycoside phosphotransferase domain-containing protein n=1 Tax=Rhynchosporium graminicola TaxID=2792576 RepID=A0A1E1K0C1_9HELO|nr:uncharacterized protein RCO7_07034 [Rhynchosporium commune]
MITTSQFKTDIVMDRYVLDHTNIPIPRVYAYGRRRLRRDSSAYQVFMVLDYIDGRPLTKKLLRDSPEDCRRRFFGEVVDMFAQLRRLEFALGGSLMPSATAGPPARLWTFMFPREESFTPRSTIGLEFEPKIVGAFSLRKNELQVDGYTAARSTAKTANEFLRDRYQLLRYMWQMPCRELGQEEAEREEFALHALSLEEAQKALGLQADSSGESFCLSHPDPRVHNIIVDDELHIRGIIDWEFSVTVPRHFFLPPSWVTGHDLGSIAPKLSAEFMNVLSSRKHLSCSHSQLARDWDFRNELTLPIAYIMLDPSDLVLLFYRYIYPKLYNESRDKVVTNFFQNTENKEPQVTLVQRLRASEQYTQYLKDNNLFDDDSEDPEWQKIIGRTVEAQKKLQELRQWCDKTQGELTRLEGQRPT